MEKKYFVGLLYNIVYNSKYRGITKNMRVIGVDIMKSKYMLFSMLIIIIFTLSGCVQKTEENDNTKFGSDGWHSTKVGKTDYSK